MQNSFKGLIGANLLAIEEIKKRLKTAPKDIGFIELLDKYSKKHVLIFSRHVYEELIDDIEKSNFFSEIINILDLSSLLLDNLIRKNEYSVIDYMLRSERILNGTILSFLSDLRTKYVLRRMPILLTLRWLILFRHYFNDEKVE